MTADERGSARTPQSGAVLFQVRVGGGLDLRCDVRGAVGVLDVLAGFEDLLHVGDGEHREAEFGFDGLHRGRVGILGLLHAVHAQYQADDLDVRLGLELRDDLAHSGAGGHHVIDEQDLHAVRKLRADHHAAVAMVLLLLAVEGVADLHAMGGRQRDGGGHAQRDALVGRAEHGVDVLGQVARLDLLDNLLGVERAETGDLASVVECAGVDEVRRLAAGLQCELAEFQRLRFQQELGETMVERCVHLQKRERIKQIRFC